jgi:hypothetical protein
MSRLVFVLALLAASPSTSYAFGSARNPGAGDVGVGLELGYPANGITVNTYLGRDLSLQIDGTVWTRHDWLGLGARVDLLWWMPRLVDLGWGDLVWYWGPGGNVFWYEWQGRGDVDGFVHLGAELPVGIGVRLGKVPMDLTLEVVPVFRVLGPGGLDFDFGLTAAFNARWYF